MPSVRRRQLGQLTAALGDRDRPLVLLGDFNTLLSRDHQTISALCGELGLIAWEPQLDAPTFPSSRPMRRLDWILASPELEFVSARSDRDASVEGNGTFAQSDKFTLGIREQITFEVVVRVRRAQA